MTGSCATQHAERRAYLNFSSHGPHEQIALRDICSQGKLRAESRPPSVHLTHPISRLCEGGAQRGNYVIIAFWRQDLELFDRKPTLRSQPSRAAPGHWRV